MPLNFDDLIPAAPKLVGKRAGKASPNPFDQFDTPQQANPFDQFDPPAQGPWTDFQDGPWNDFQKPQNAGGSLSFDDLIPAKATGPNPFDQFDTPQQAPPHKFGLMDTWPARLATAIYNAVTLPHDVYEGTAAVPQSPNMLGGEDTSAIGRVSDLAALGSGFMSNRAALMGGTAGPTGQQLKSAAQTGYEQAKNIGVELRPEAMDNFGVLTRSKLDEQGLNSEIVPKTHAVLGKLSQYPADSTVNANNLRTIQKSLGNVKNLSNDPAERMAAGQALGDFNKLLENLDQVPGALSRGAPEDAAQFSQLVKDANGNYQAYKQGDAFDLRGQAAENNTAASHSGMNLENNLRSQVRQILNNPKLQRGYDAQTLQAMQDFNNGSRTANTMRLVGNLMGGGGGLGMLAAGSVSHLLGLPFELGPGIGLGLKSIANQRALGGFNTIGDMIRANSPLARSGFTNPTPSPVLTSGAAGTYTGLPSFLGTAVPYPLLGANETNAQ